MSIVARLAAFLALGAAVAAAGVRYSLRYGRLALPPTFDDVVYLNDAAQRLQEFRDSGISGLIAGAASRTLRSPYSTAEAFISFLIFGMHDWAPYAGNAVLVAGFFVLADWLCRGLRGWHKLCIFALSISSPFLIRSAMTCRPDFAAALLTTAAVFAITGRRTPGARVADALGAPMAAGLLFGLAILAKPSVFAATAAVMLACGIAAIASRALLARPRSRVREALRRGMAAYGVCVIIALLVATPYAIVQGAQTLRYVYRNSLGENASVWAYKGTFRESLLYYLTGPGAHGMRGQQPTLIIVTITAIVFYTRRRRLSDIAAIAPVAAALLVSYAVCTANPMKNEFLGLTFQICLLYTVIAALRNFVVSQRARAQRPWAELILIVVTGCAVIGFRLPDRIASPDAPVTRAQRDAADQLFRSISRNTAGVTPSAGRRRIFVTFNGRISAPLFNYMAAKRRDPLEFYDLGFSREVERYAAELDVADMVVSCDPAMGRNLSSEELAFVTNFPPSVDFRGALPTIIEHSPDYALVARVEYPPNHCFFYVYQRRH